MRNLYHLARVVCVATGIFACSSERGPSVGGETHWLTLCKSDSECGDDALSCICGTCTRACTDDKTCEDGLCYDTQSPLLLERCEERGLHSSRGICLAQCDADLECGDGRACVRGACVPETADGVVATAPSGTSIEDYVDVDPEISWTDPLSYDAPATSIEGADGTMLGRWIETGCQPNLEAGGQPWNCLALVLERKADGTIGGHFNLSYTSEPVGPFAPPTDPNLGYPTEVSAEQYEDMSLNLQPTVDYRLLNGRLSGGRLRFEWTQLDIWADWCSMQTPYEWNASGRTLHFCVPQSPDARDGMSFEKVVLCRSFYFEPGCVDGDDTTPCSSCDAASPLCSPSVCGCDARGCHVATEFDSWGELEFSADGQQAELVMSFDTFTQVPYNLRRER